ncbi:zf-C2HC5-domain-containing protein [Ascodesmis nigricans]|uniref:Zf-C2HC5-domain-containing protein n=1 Tax=Ascodesmis nigricans TaxID=341454 RepID=A0A4S2N0I4_9PEZI|nr:zf-C2HC5-domain-containing protein [Ascodesmis nigricans]
MSNSHQTQSWAIAELSKFLPLPEDELKQVYAYAASLSSASEVAQHFQGLLDDSPGTLTFISDLNSRLFPSYSSSTSKSNPPLPPSSSSSSAPTKPRGNRKKKAPLNTYANAPRRANDGHTHLAPGGVYMKKDMEDEYFTGRRSDAPSSSSPRKPSPSGPPPKLSPAGGILTSQLPNIRTKTVKANTSSPAQSEPPSEHSSVTSSGPKKIHITGGSSMRGATHDLAFLDSALRSLEESTNPTLTHRRCDCQGLKHEPFAAAPNCLNCGKIICMVNGPGPCSFCGSPLLSGSETQALIKALRQERGHEKMAMDAAAHQKATIHRDRLLGFQRDNTQRTRIIDQAADWDAGDSGGDMWMTPQEKALQLKRQQKALEKILWSGKQDYEKRRIVVSIDIKGKKVVREMQAIPAPGEEDEGMDSEEEKLAVAAAQSRAEREKQSQGASSGSGTGKYAKNPLLKGLIRPVYDAKGKGAATLDDGIGAVGGYANRDLRWRRVQDSLEDNEEVILDGPRKGGGEGKLRGDVGGPCG